MHGLGEAAGTITFRANWAFLLIIDSNEIQSQTSECMGRFRRLEQPWVAAFVVPTAVTSL
jgi:hypothetical protein